MCFELMKEEFVEKVRWIGRSLHIVTEDVNGEMDDDIAGEIPGTGEGTIGGELRRVSSFAIPSNGSDNGLLDSVSVASSTAAKTDQDSCPSENILKNSSPEFKKPIGSLNRHKGLVDSKASTKQPQRTASVRSTNNDENFLATEGEFGFVDMDSGFGGEDNEAFGEDMVYEEKEDEIAKNK